MTLSCEPRKLTVWERECRLNEIMFKAKPKVLTEQMAKERYSLFYNTILEKVKTLWTIHQIQLEKVFERMPTKTERAIRLASASLGLVGAVLPPVFFLAHLGHITSEIIHLISETGKECIEIGHEVKEAFEKHETAGQINAESILQEICFNITLRYRGEIQRLDSKQCHEFALLKAYNIIDKLKTCNSDFKDLCTHERALELIMDHIDPDPAQHSFQILWEYLAKHNTDSDARKDVIYKFAILVMAVLTHIRQENKTANHRVFRDQLASYGILSATISKFSTKESGTYKLLGEIFPQLLEFENWNLCDPNKDHTKYHHMPFNDTSSLGKSWCKDFSNLAMTINRLVLHKLLLINANSNTERTISEQKFIQKVAVPHHLVFMLKMIQNLAKALLDQKNELQNLKDRVNRLEQLTEPLLNNNNNVNDNYNNNNNNNNDNDNVAYIQNQMIQPVNMIQPNFCFNPKEFMDNIPRFNSLKQVKILMRSVPFKREGIIPLPEIKKLDEESFWPKLTENSRDYLRSIHLLRVVDRIYHRRLDDAIKNNIKFSGLLLCQNGEWLRNHSLKRELKPNQYFRLGIEDAQLFSRITQFICLAHKRPFSEVTPFLRSASDKS